MRIRPPFPSLLSRISLLATSALWASSAVSAVTRAPEVLSWEKCVEIARENNSELRAARATLEATRALERSARSGLFPKLSGTLSATRSSTGTNITTGAGFGSFSSSVQTYAASLSVSQNIFSGLQDWGRIAQAEANTRAAQAALEIAEARISYELKSNYEGLLYANENARLTEEIAKRREDNRRLVELRFESGRENKGSLLLAEAYKKQARYENLVATNSIQTARAQLAKTLGLDGEAEIQIEGAIPQTPPPPETLDWQTLAKSTPDRIQASARESAAESAITQARAGFFPSLNLVGSVGRQDREFFPGNPRWSVGLSLTFPLFDGFKDVAAIRNASASSIAATETRIHLDRELIARLKQARNAFAEAFEKLEVDASFREAARTRAEIGRNRYNNGLLTFEDWDLIESDLIARQKSYLQSKRDRSVQEAAWEQAQGKGVF